MSGTACNARPWPGHPMHGTGVACHMYRDHEGPHTWEYEPSLARLGLNRLLALMPTRELESLDNQNARFAEVRDAKTGEALAPMQMGGPGPWVVVTFVGGDTYGIWKATGAVYRQLTDGSMDEDPMLTLEGSGLSEDERRELRRTPPPEPA